MEEAQEKDLPQTAMTHLKKIEQKASKEIAATPTVTTNAYGQWLKAVLLHAKLQAEVAPDSLIPAVQRLEQRDHTNEKAGIGAGGNKGFVCTEKAEEGPPRLLPSSTWKKRMRTELFCSSGSSFAVALSSLKR